MLAFKNGRVLNMPTSELGTINMITSWSFSRFQDFFECAYRAKLKYIDKLPDDRPKPAADRGTAIHQLAEDYVRGTLTKVPQELMKFSEEFITLKRLNKEGKVSLEGEWGFDKNWNITDWKHAWGRIKADAVIHPEPGTAVVIDYKTGRKFGNEVKHAEQLQLYAVATCLREPSVQHVVCELWYLDQDDLTRIDVSRKAVETKFLKHFDKKAHKITSATSFPANPNKFVCKWCPYTDGRCEHAYHT